MNLNPSGTDVSKLLLEQLRTRFQDAATAKHVKLIFPSLANISKSCVPTLDCAADGDAVITKTSNL